uniref:B box-type domain-containing protein n=1 Tax=Acrobeloides nanus TaxID=290746 RepID=A0A914DIP7_9BILA
MEEELKCPGCREFLREPILLQCAHSYCRECALRAQQKISNNSQPTFHAYGIHQSPLSPQCSSSGASDTISLCVSDPDQESDKLSVVSETDSGVVICGRNSRPCSFVGVPNSHSGTTSTFNPLTARIPSILTPSTSGYTIICDACQKPSFYSDENALRIAPENTALRRLITRIRGSSNTPSISSENTDASNSSHPTCQWCESAPNPAELYCEVCGYYYCAPCQSIVHPPRGPLKDHKLLPALTFNRCENWRWI